MKKIHLFFIAALLLTGCSPYTLVNSETYNNANLSSYTTFRIVTPDEGAMVPGMQAVTYYNIAAAIREQMVERGYVEDASSPLLVNIGLSVQKEIQTEPMLPPNYYPYYGPMPAPGYYPFFMYPRQYYWPSYYNNAQVITGIYKEGVLTMDMVNTVDKLPLYSASVATIVDGGNSGYRNLSGIAEAVKTLFSKYPVPLLPQYRNHN
jgi:lipoprotein